MADRATLHFNKIDDFVAWAATKGWEREEHLPAAYEVLRLRKKGKPPCIYYSTTTATQHATSRGHAAAQLVRNYVNAKKRKEWPR